MSRLSVDDSLQGQALEIIVKWSQEPIELTTKSDRIFFSKNKSNDLLAIVQSISTDSSQNICGETSNEQKACQSWMNRALSNAHSNKITQRNLLFRNFLEFFLFFLSFLCNSFENK